MSQIVVSENSFNDADLTTVIYSCASFLRLVLEEGGDEDDLHPDALRSFAVSYFLDEVNNGGFSQFVYNTGRHVDLLADIAAGLAAMGAEDHLAWFNARREFVDSPQISQGLSGFFASEYFGENPFRDSLNDDSFFDIEADLVAINAAWLRSHPDLVVVSIPEMFTRAEAIVGHPIEQST